MNHKIAFFTSTRSDMTILEPLLNEIKHKYGTLNTDGYIVSSYSP